MSILLVQAIQNDLPTGGIMTSQNEFKLYKGSSPQLLEIFQRLNGRYFNLNTNGDWLMNIGSKPELVTDPIVLAILNDENNYAIPSFERYDPFRSFPLEGSVTVFNLTTGYSIEYWYRDWVRKLE